MRSFGVLLLLTLALVGINGFPEKKSFTLGEKYNGLTFIGSAKKQRGTQQSESVYFTNGAMTDRAGANLACIQLLGYDASLLSLETDPELEDVYDMLVQSDSDIESFWTAGKYERERGLWSWEKGDSVQSDIWADMEPSRESPTSKLLMKKENRTLIAYSKEDSEVHNSICELIWGSSSEPIPCYNTNDLVIVVDSSGSIGAEGYRLAIDFAKKLATSWTAWKNIQIGYMIYGYEPHVRRSLKPVGEDEIEILRIIGDSPYLAEGTRSDLALAKAFDEVYASNRTDEPVPQNVVFLTDGQTSPSSYKPDTKANAKRLHDHVVRTFAVAIGTETNLDFDELNYIASHPSHVFTVREFASLELILKPLSNLACDPNSP